MRLDNARHELFAQALASGKSAHEAYRLVGYKTNRGNAVRLKANENVVARVKELQRELFDDEKLDRAWVRARLMRNADNENGAVSNRALELLGKTMGMFKDDGEMPIQHVQPATGNVVRPDFAAMTKKFGA